MEPTLFKYIWRFSARDQLMLLALTIGSFPLLYMTLEIPKLIVNDAIGAAGAGGAEQMVQAYGLSFTQVEYLFALCGAFLLFVILSGVVKMRINTFKGIVAERLLRRFRYMLLERIQRFPLPHFRKTSQGELVSIVTSEAEPLGGVMGDAVAQPVFQAGQMLTILLFLFMQNVWFGLAAIALIPVQAYLIPMLQRRINLLNKERVQNVRRLAESIGESVAGSEDLRINNGLNRLRASFSHRLGVLFRIRHQIYQKKFFMKFLNNFINQLTPFFFYAIGGYLVIQGEMTVGALVAALAAYKDLSSPWKELLAYYNQVQDMSLRYDTIAEQFAPRGMVDAALFEGRPAEIPRLNGPITLQSATVTGANGGVLLDGLDAELPGGAMIAVQCANAMERRAFGQLLTRSVSPASGAIAIGGHALAGLHQGVLATRIGYAGGAPYLFNRPIADNVTMGLLAAPQSTNPERSSEAEEAALTGNSPEDAEADWLDPGVIGLSDRAAVKDWWWRIIQGIGSADYLFQICVNRQIDPEGRPDIAEGVVALRPKIAERLRAEGLDKAVHRFEPGAFNPGLDLASNLLFAVPRSRSDVASLAADPRFRAMIQELALEAPLLKLAENVLSTLVQAFGDTGAAHPLFRRLSGLDGACFDRLAAVHERRGDGPLSDDDRFLLLTLPFVVSAEQLGEQFPASLRTQILSTCREKIGELSAEFGDLFSRLDETAYAPGLSVLENALFGKLSIYANGDADRIRQVVAELCDEAGLKGPIALLIGEIEAGIGGANLPPIAHERIGFVRAAIKKPDILILDQALASNSAEQRQLMRRNLRRLLPETTIIFLEPSFANPTAYDQFLEIKDGRLVGGHGRADAAADTSVDALIADVASGAGDLKKKRQVLAEVSLFEGLEDKQLNLLAYASRWIEAEAGQPLFRRGDKTDGAYVLTEGQAELRWPGDDSENAVLSLVEPGRLIGDLSVIRGVDREIDMIAATPVVGLRIGKRELLEIIEHDPAVATALLRTVAGYLSNVASKLIDARHRLPEAQPAARK